MTVTRSGVFRRSYLVCDNVPVSQDSATEVGAELVLDEVWRRLLALAGTGQEGLELVADGLVEQRVGGASRGVLRRSVPGLEGPRTRGAGRGLAGGRLGSDSRGHDADVPLRELCPASAAARRPCAGVCSCVHALEDEGLLPRPCAPAAVAAGVMLSRLAGMSCLAANEPSRFRIWLG